MERLTHHICGSLYGCHIVHTLTLWTEAAMYLVLYATLPSTWCRRVVWIGQCPWLCLTKHIVSCVYPEYQHSPNEWFNQASPRLTQINLLINYVRSLTFSLVWGLTCLTTNYEVAGSNPATSTILILIQEKNSNLDQD